MNIENKNDIKMSLAVYPWPHQLEYDIENSLHVILWENFCKDRCENFINYFPYFFNHLKSSLDNRRLKLGLIMIISMYSQLPPPFFH